MKTFWSLVGVVALIVGIWYVAQNMKKAPVAVVAPTPSLVAAANYACDGTRSTVAASYYQMSATAAQGNQPSTSGGSVTLAFNDGRNLTLQQTVSADGARYANAEESFIFWNKGNAAIVTEGPAQPYNCIQVAADPGNLPQTFESDTEAFSIRYPANYSVDSAYQYKALGPGKEILGVKFTIDPAIATSTNLSPDSYFSVEQIATSTCSAELFLGKGAKAQAMTEGDTAYSVATSSGAAAGNRYEETVYAWASRNPCLAVRYFIHYAAIQNFPKGKVTEFDKAALIAQFDSIRKTLTVAH